MKKKQVLDSQCPCCSAPLFYNTTTNHFKCEYCDSVFTLKDLEKVEDAKIEEIEEQETENEIYMSYKCTNCGAEIVADEHTSSTFCLYCGNAAILKDKLSGKFKPDKIIPFKTEKETAIKAFKNLAKGRPLIAKDFISEKNINKIIGLYVPFWLYQIKTQGSLEAKGIQVKTWSRGDIRYTKKDFYDLKRTGEMVYERVPVDGSTRFNNEIMNTIEPFNYNYLIDFNYRYLSGFLAEKYDINSTELFKEAEERVLASAKDIMYNDMGNYTIKTTTSNTIKAKKHNAEYALLPVWMVNVKYKNKYYLFAMNGQTGEFIGNIPLNKTKALIYTILIFIVVFILVILISYLPYVLGV